MAPLRLILTILLSTVFLAEADWLTYAHDPQRTGSTADENKISTQNAGGMKLLWQTQLDNLPLALSALTAPLVASDVNTSEGPKTLVFVAGSSNTFFAVNAADGQVVWKHTFTSFVKAKEDSFYLCPNSANATPVIDKERGIAYTIATDGRIYGLDLATGDLKFGPFAFIPPFAKAWSLNLNNGVIFTTTSQSCGGDRSGVYAMRVTDPKHTESQELLMRQGFGGGMWSRGGTAIGRNGDVYVATGDGAFNPAVGDYSNTYAAVASPLRVRDYFAPLNWKDISKQDLDLPSGGEAIFPFAGRELLVGGGKESTVYLLDTASLGGRNHDTPLYATPVLANEGRALEEKGIWGVPAVWTDEEHQTWVYVPVWGALTEASADFPVRNGETPHGCILAFKVASGKGSPTLQPAWISPDFNLPDPPVVANGVLFALATGENPRQDHILGKTKYKSMEDWRNNLLTTEQRSAGTHPAVLMALDARTGKLLFQSGDAMKSWVHFSGLAVSDGRVYAVDHESRLYCFGLVRGSDGQR